MRKKTESKSVGPLKDEEFVPWSGITLNRCLAVAAIAALLSVGFQVLQETTDPDDLAEEENDVWTPLESNDQQSEPWFFEGWFGSSTSNLPVVEEPGAQDIEEPGAQDTEEPEAQVTEEPEAPDDEEVLETEAPEESVINEQELSSEEQDEEIQTELLIQEPLEPEKKKEKQEQEKASEHWGLKSKSKYMEFKGNKIKTATKDGPRKEVFPFNLAKKQKDSAKSYSAEKEKPYKDKKHQSKYEEKKHDHSKKEYEKQSKKEKGDKNKYSKQDKGKREDKDYKGNKQHNYEKDYKKKYDSRHHG